MTINTLTGVLVALGALDPESIQLSLKCAVLESKAKKANPPLPKRLRPAPVLSIYSGLGYAELPGRREIESALTQPRCWSALGAPSQAKAEASTGAEAPAQRPLGDDVVRHRLVHRVCGDEPHVERLRRLRGHRLLLLE